MLKVLPEVSFGEVKTMKRKETAWLNGRKYADQKRLGVLGYSI
jgi:hypothetical protein